MKIYLSELIEANACVDQVKLFKARFGASVTVTKALLIKHAGEFDLDFYVVNCMSKTQRKAYDAATAEVWKAYRAATAEASKAYDAAKAEPSNAYDAATAEASKAYRAATAEAFYQALKSR